MFDLTNPHNKYYLERLKDPYIRYKFRNSKVELGRFELNTPFINRQDGRMRGTIEEGVGAELNFKKFSLSQTLSGYQGYLDIGDRPLNYKASLNWKGRKFDAKLWYQLGLNDYPYQSLRAGVIYHIAL